MDLCWLVHNPAHICSHLGLSDGLYPQCTSLAQYVNSIKERNNIVEVGSFVTRTKCLDNSRVREHNTGIGSPVLRQPSLTHLLPP
jgi:hypothetical protein